MVNDTCTCTCTIGYNRLNMFTSRPVCDIWLFAAKGVVVH